MKYAAVAWECSNKSKKKKYAFRSNFHNLGILKFQFLVNLNSSAFVCQFYYNILPTTRLSELQD